MSNLLDQEIIRIKLSEESLNEMRFERMMDELSSDATAVIAFRNQITRRGLDANRTNFLYIAATTAARHDRSRRHFSDASALTLVIHSLQFIIIIAGRRPHSPERQESHSRPPVCRGRGRSTPSPAGCPSVTHNGAEEGFIRHGALCATLSPESGGKQG